MGDWRARLLESDEKIGEALREARRIAVLGIKTEAQDGQPAYYVPRYLQRAGYEVVPVPVYFPEVTRILDEPVYRSISAIPEPVDVVNVFRRSSDLEKHVDDLIEARPGLVWMQTGIRHEGVAKRLAEAGIAVVQDRCLMVEHSRLGRGRG
jgi:uncharacterized protein